MAKKVGKRFIDYIGQEPRNPAQAAAAMREWAREALKGDDWLPGGRHWRTFKRLMPPRMKHFYKKKFVNLEEAAEWARERGHLGRPYKCHECPFIHLSTKGIAHAGKKEKAKA
jgi:hypothetical protein